MIVFCTWIGDSFFLNNGKEDWNMPLKDFSVIKMDYQERRRGRTVSLSNLIVWIIRER